MTKCSFFINMPFTTLLFMSSCIVVLFYKAGMQEDTLREQQFAHLHATCAHKHTHTHKISLPHVQVHIHIYSQLQHCIHPYTLFSRQLRVYTELLQRLINASHHTNEPLGKQQTKHEDPWLRNVTKGQIFSVKWLLTYKKEMNLNL